MTGMSGYDSGFLAVALPLPVAAPDRRLVRLDYTHFEVALDPVRKLAAFTAVNIDGGALADVPRSADAWFVDRRAPAEQQTGAAVYARNDLDRGHLVRRRDPVWGAVTVARAANSQTFSYANAAPQASGFNQSKELWLGLEDYVLDAADAADARISVFTGPIFGDDDQLYRGTRLPKQFFKVAAWVRDGALEATGYVLDQSPLLSDLPALVAESSDEPLLGPFRTFQVPIADIARLTSLDLGPLPAADRSTPARIRPRPWREVTSPDQLTF